VPETPLNSNGHQQAKLAAERIQSSFDVHKILSSDLQRTQDTASAISKATGALIELTHLLQERNFGDLRGLPFASLKVNPFTPGYVPPGGESEAMLEARVDKAWEQILREAQKTPPGKVLCVVSHGLVLNCISKRYLAIDPTLKSVPVIPFSNTSLTLVNLGEGGNMHPVVDGLFNCDRHLSEEHRDPLFGKVISSI